ncbi:MAG TPA: hypothetical protein VNM48_01880 [Chloroflexota bacterium]|nr:hypothetical protein [Chloroflexota bacterium]
MSTDTQTVDLTIRKAWEAVRENKSPADALRGLVERLLTEWEAAVAPAFPLPRPYLTAELDDYWNQMHQFVDAIIEDAEADDEVVAAREDAEDRVRELEALIEDARQADTLTEARAILEQA